MKTTTSMRQPTTPLTLNFKPFPSKPRLRGEDIPLDVFVCIAEKIPDGRTLKSLSSISKSVRTVVAPKLFERGIALGDKHVLTMRDEARFRRIKRIPYLSVVKSLRVSISGEKSPTSLWDLEGRMEREAYRRECNRGIAELVGLMPGLTDFQWDNGLVMLESTFTTLKTSCKNLASVHLNFSDDMETGLDSSFDLPRSNRLSSENDDDDETRPSSPDFVVLKSFSLVGLENLTSLSLETLFGSATKLAEELASVLLACPKLESLALSISDQTVNLHAQNSYPDASINDIILLLETLVSLYRKKGGKPLPLRQLYLGKNVLFWDRILLADGTDSTWNADRLCELVNLQTLEKIEIWNDLPSEIEDALSFHSFGFNAFLQNSAPNLASMTVEDWSQEFWQFLRDVLEDPSAPPSFLSSLEGSNLGPVESSIICSLPAEKAEVWPKSLKIHNLDFECDEEIWGEGMVDGNTLFPLVLSELKGLEYLLLGLSEYDWYRITHSSAPRQIVLPRVRTFAAVATSPDNVDRFLKSVMVAFPGLEFLSTATAEYQVVWKHGERKVRLLRDKRGNRRDFEIIPGPELAVGCWAWD